MFRAHQTEAVIRTYKNLENAMLPKAYLASFTLMEKNRTKVYHTKKEDFQLCLCPLRSLLSHERSIYLLIHLFIYTYLFLLSLCLRTNLLGSSF